MTYPYQKHLPECPHSGVVDKTDAGCACRDDLEPKPLVRNPEHALPLDTFGPETDQAYLTRMEDLLTYVLAKVRRDTAERAWQEGHEARANHVGYAENPYRIAREEASR